MASGILGTSNPSATTLTTLYTVPSAKLATLTLAAVNMASTPAYIRVAISTSGTPSASEYIEFDSILGGLGSTLDRTGIVLDATKRVVVYASTADVAFNVYGFEEAA